MTRSTPNTATPVSDPVRGSSSFSTNGEHGLIRRIEERSLNAWPALSRIFLDGWIVGLSEGYTRRANSVNPIYGGVLATEEKIPLCEQAYAERGLPAVFKITPLSERDGLDALLAASGYQKVATTSVQTRTLDGAFADISEIEILCDADDHWMRDYALIKGFDAAELRKTQAILERIGVAKRFVSVYSGNRRVAAGIATIEADTVGLFGVAVAPPFRGNGLGRRVTQALLEAGHSSGGRLAYLQVEMDNPVAHRLYDTLGFREIYTYWYRVKS